MVERDKNETQGYCYRIYFGKGLNGRRVLVIDAHTLKRRGKAVPQMQRKQRERKYVNNGTPEAFELFDGFRMISSRVFGFASYVFVIYFMNPKIVKMKPQKSQYDKTGNNHISRHP